MKILIEAVVIYNEFIFSHISTKFPYMLFHFLGTKVTQDKLHSFFTLFIHKKLIQLLTFHPIFLVYEVKIELYDLVTRWKTAAAMW